MRKAPTIELNPEDAQWLTRSAASRLSSVRLAERCRVVLLAAEGKTNEQISAELGMERIKVGRWRARFATQGRPGIESDAPGRGRKPTYSAEDIELVIEKTTLEKPEGATHWSRSLMAKQTGISEAAIF